MTQFRLNLEQLTSELLTGGFRAMTQADKDAFADAGPGTLIGEVKRGKHTYLCLFDPKECFFECYDWSDTVTTDARCWRVCSILGTVTQL